MREVGVVLGKPSPKRITLEQHTRNVLTQWEKVILPMHGFARDKYARITGKSLHELTRFAVLWHDAGKQHKEWQDACWKDYLVLKQWADGGQVGKCPPATALQRTGIRHEMDSLLRVRRKYPEASPVVLAAIAAHHNKLGERHRKRWEEDDKGNFRNEWKQLQKLSNALHTEETDIFQKALLQRYEYAGPRAFLQLADGRASAAEADNYVPTFQPFTYAFPHSSPRGVQQKITELWDEPFALLRAPTGAGKTDAALLWAKHQVEQGRADRLVIAMPTRFTANALSISTAETLSLVGLHHSTARHQRRNELWEVVREEQQMARLLETPVTVTTLDHLCISLTGAREDHHATFFNLAHSCVVIDEADFYDDFTQANIVVLLHALNVLQVPVLLMSATLPESSRQLYRISDREPTIHEDTTDGARVRCVLKRFPSPVVHPHDMDVLLQEAVDTIDTEPTIIYCNTVQRAQRVYDWLEKNHAKMDDVVLYHSRFTEPHKKAIEERLTDMLGRDAWKEERAQGIAVLTQIGELSVNISANRMISELCPLDRLVQRVGRLSRFAKADGEFPKGVLHLIEPHKADGEGSKLYPAPYGSYIKGKGWEESCYLKETNKALVEREYTANNFVEMVNELYKQLPETPVKACLNAKELDKRVVANWLIVPGNEVKDDADETSGMNPWRCRDIDTQVTVFVEMKQDNGLGDKEDTSILQTRYSNWGAWQRVALDHGVSCYSYELSKAQENSWVSSTEVEIGDGWKETKVTAWLANRPYYSDKRGLQFRDPAEETE